MTSKPLEGYTSHHGEAEAKGGRRYDRKDGQDIGAVPGVAGAYVATGHGSGGMLNAPATGEAMAELILDGAAKTLDLSAFDPARLPTLEQVTTEK